MPITVAEKWDGREGTTGDGASTDLRYIIQGTDDDAAARDALVANSPEFYNLLIRSEKSCGYRLKVKPALAIGIVSAIQVAKRLMLRPSDRLFRDVTLNLSVD